MSFQVSFGFSLDILWFFGVTKKYNSKINQIHRLKLSLGGLGWSKDAKTFFFKLFFYI